MSAFYIVILLVTLVDSLSVPNGKPLKNAGGETPSTVPRINIRPTYLPGKNHQRLYISIQSMKYQACLLLMIAQGILSFSFRVLNRGGLLRSSSSFASSFSKRSTWKGGVRQFMSDYGKDMDQEALMESDMLIAVDENDVLITDVELSKRAGHTFNAETPRAVLHRAFSFFLFDEEGRMLLTQRAGSKITFPNVWTNTCCSHPLYGMKPDEADEVPAAYPSFPGIKHAAIRKLRHELGIDPSYIEHGRIQFIGRFHYWASDTVTYGKDAPWGEHEVDYVLFLQSQQHVPVNANPDEVRDYKYVSIEE